MSAGIRSQLVHTHANIENLGYTIDTLQNNEAIANCATCVENSSLEIVDDKSKIEKVFHRRNTLLERSCSFINQLNTANRIAIIDELKKIHLLLHDSEASHESITNTLESYDEKKFHLIKNRKIL